MKIIYSPIHKKHRPSYNINDGVKADYPEILDRVEVIKNALEKGLLGVIEKPLTFPVAHIDAIHLPNYRKFLEKKSQTLTEDSNFFASDFIMDTSAPMTSGTYMAAKSAVDVALTGAMFLQKGEKLVYSLCRPPGHHSGYVNMGGFCYFNNAAIAANYLSQYGKVAILDIDYHHGNGTQQAFYSRDDVFYISLHADPNKEYPYISGFANEIGTGKGEGYTKNYPLPLTTTEKKYLSVLDQTLLDIQKYRPQFFVLSAGFDTYNEDPIGELGLSINSYHAVGKRIAGLHFPTLVIQEGGYNIGALGDIASNLIRGLQLQGV